MLKLLGRGVRGPREPRLFVRQKGATLQCVGSWKGGGMGGGRDNVPDIQ